MFSIPTFLSQSFRTSCILFACGSTRLSKLDSSSVSFQIDINKIKHNIDIHRQKRLVINVILHAMTSTAFISEVNTKIMTLLNNTTTRFMIDTQKIITFSLVTK